MSGRRGVYSGYRTGADPVPKLRRAKHRASDPGADPLATETSRQARGVLAGGRKMAQDTATKTAHLYLIMRQDGRGVIDVYAEE
jgi:hypothetical protein